VLRNGHMQLSRFADGPKFFDLRPKSMQPSFEQLQSPKILAFYPGRRLPADLVFKQF